MKGPPVANTATSRCVPSRSFWRALAVICFLAAFLGIQIASASHLHEESAEHQHFCPVCQAGHIPALRPAVGLRLAPPTLITWRIHREPLVIVYCHLPLSQSPRAPPA